MASNWSSNWPHSESLQRLTEPCPEAALAKEMKRRREGKINIVLGDEQDIGERVVLVQRREIIGERCLRKGCGEKKRESTGGTSYL